MIFQLNKKGGKVCFLVYISLFCFLCSICTATQEQKDNNRDDIEIIKQRLVKQFLQERWEKGSSVYTIKNVYHALKNINPDGSWPEIDYKYLGLKPTAKGNIERHFSSKLEPMAMAYRAPESPLYGDVKLKRAIHLGLNYWLDNNFRHEAWSHDLMRIPAAIARLFIMLDKELTEEEIQKGLVILERANPERKKVKRVFTGQNIIWLGEINAMRGLILRDYALVKKMYHIMAATLEPGVEGKRNGIQHDFTYRHNHIFYNHGYGAPFAKDSANLCLLLAGTQFSLPEKAINTLTSFILDSSQWMIRKGYIDYSAAGRCIADKWCNRAAGSFLTAARAMRKVPTGRKEEFSALIDRMEKKPDARPLEGNRFFWLADMMSHHRQAYYASVRMYSPRIPNTEVTCANRLGLKSHHIADGANFIMRTGNEYRYIQAVWDWQKIPGTTVVQKPKLGEIVKTGGGKYVQIFGLKDFAGGVSDGTYGMAAFDFVNPNDRLKVHKAWFFFDKEFVCLGNSITTPSMYRYKFYVDPRRHAVTTLNQCNLQGDVTAYFDNQKQILKKGAHKLKRPSWVYHDKIAYIFPERRMTDVYISNDIQKGSWQQLGAYQSKTEVSMDVFKLWIDHGELLGRRPYDSNAPYYSYIVVPGIEITDIPSYISKNEVQILKNNYDIQAVKHGKLKITQIAFYKAGSLKIDAKTTVKVSCPCLVMVQQVKEGLKITVSDPSQKLAEIYLSVDAKFKGDGCSWDKKNVTRVLLEMPQGNYAGQSIVRILTRP